MIDRGERVREPHDAAIRGSNALPEIERPKALGHVRGDDDHRRHPQPGESGWSLGGRRTYATVDPGGVERPIEAVFAGSVRHPAAWLDATPVSPFPSGSIRPAAGSGRISTVASHSATTESPKKAKTLRRNVAFSTV